MKRKDVCEFFKDVCVCVEREREREREPIGSYRIFFCSTSGWDIADDDGDDGGARNVHVHINASPLLSFHSQEHLFLRENVFVFRCCFAIGPAIAAKVHPHFLADHSRDSASARREQRDAAQASHSMPTPARK